MGSEVTATCRCGAESNIMIGGGMANFITTCYFPCACMRCNNVVQVNLLTKQKRCPKCRSTKVIPYDDSSLLEAPGEHTVANWNMDEQLGRELILTDGSYKCPQCGQMTLHFMDSGLCWD